MKFIFLKRNRCKNCKYWEFHSSGIMRDLGRCIKYSEITCDYEGKLCEKFKNK